MSESMASSPAPPTAALVVIGNEILSGKVRDDNIQFLAQELFAMGWILKEIVVIPDEHATVVQVLRRLKETYNHVFTSGGVGPTHDDITLGAVAEATEKALVVSPMLEHLLKKFYDVDLLTPSQQRLAMVPEGAVLHYAASSSYPQMLVDNVYPLPGIPDLFRKKFAELQELWPASEPRQRRCLNLVAMETDLAELLAKVAGTHPDVSLGSYPTEKDGVWHLELVLEAADVAPLERAFTMLIDALGPQITVDTGA